MTETQTVQELAGEAASWFETARRDATEGYVRTKDGAPEWVAELVRAAHGSDFLPDDYRYRWTSEALEAIAEADDPDDAAGDFADGAVDVYTAGRFAWLSSNLNRAGYVDEAMEELGAEQVSAFSDLVEWIGRGMYCEAEEVFGLVLESLEHRRDELDAAEAFGELDEEA